MSELQAILARRRRLNNEASDEADPQSPVVEEQVSSEKDVIASPPPQLDSAIASPPPSARIAVDLQAKLQERRLKAAHPDDDYNEKHPPHEPSSSLEPSPRHKSSFFPRSTPPVVRRTSPTPPQSTVDQVPEFMKLKLKSNGAKKEIPNKEDTPIEVTSPPASPMLFVNYDTAVMAAKDAIDASNRSRHNNHNEEEDDTTTTNDTNDQSLVDENTPISQMDTINNNNAFAATSFVPSNIDMFANNSDEDDIETKDSPEMTFGFASTPLFDVDPFDPFAITENNNDMEEEFPFLTTTNPGEMEGLYPTFSEESNHHFDAQFDDNFGVMTTTTNNQEQNTTNEVQLSRTKEEDVIVDEDNNEDEDDIVEDDMVDEDDNSFDEDLSENNNTTMNNNTADGNMDAPFLHVDETSQVMEEDTEYTNDEEVIFNDTFATFHKYPLTISFGDPNNHNRIPNPTQNPLSGNLIICRCESNGDFFIEEVDTTSIKTPTVFLSTRIVPDEFSIKLCRVFGTRHHMKVLGVPSILSLAAGIHRVQGKERVRVASLLELVVASPNNAGVKRIRVVAVWKWGYNSGGRDLVSLQSVLSTTGMDDETSVYDHQTLQVADGLLFLAGYTKVTNKATTPTVFLAKPVVRDGWVPVSVSIVQDQGQSEKEELAVSTLAAINDTNPFLAVGLTDGSISVWSYDVATRTNRIATQDAAKGNDQTLSLLRNVCRMNGEIDIVNLSKYDCLWKDDGVSKHSNRTRFHGGCTCLSWITPCSSGISALPLLAATFQTGVAVYHVELLQESEDDESSSSVDPLCQVIPPLALARYYGARTNLIYQAKISWVDLGPRSPPCFSIFTQGNSTMLSLCVIDIPWYGSSEMINENSNHLHRSIGTLSQIICDYAADDACIFTLSHLGSMGCYSRGAISLYQPYFSSQPIHSKPSFPAVTDGYLSSLYRPVSSQSLGINTDGSIHSNENTASVKSEYEDTVLSVFSTNTCSRGHDSSSLNTRWTFPSQRNWLCITAPGDKPLRSLVIDEPVDDFNKSNQQNDERCGAVSDILCELTCGENPVSGLVPERIVREDGGRRAAILFASTYFGSNYGLDTARHHSRTHTRVRIDPVAYALLDIDEIMKNRSSTTFTLRYARDVAFLPTCQMEGGFYCSSIVVLDPDGMGLSITTIISSRSNDITTKVIESDDKFLLRYEGIKGRRVFTLLNGDAPQLLLAGFSAMAGRPCLIVAQHELQRDSHSNTYTLIESDTLGHRLWLNADEEVLSVRELPKHPNAARSLIAAATQARVMILEVNGESLSIVAEVNVYLSCPSLSPVGSHCVIFSASSTPYSSAKSSIMYLSCLKSTYRHGVLLSFPSKRNVSSGHAHIMMAALRPDRIVISTSHGSVRLSDENEAESKFKMPLPSSIPVLLLEPLLANALCLDGNCGENAYDNILVQQSLRLIIERFGRKDTSLPHSENEGIGCFGAGITSKVYQMLAQHRCYRAASLLLTGSPNCSRTQTTLLPPWVPISSKILATIDSDIRLRLLEISDSEMDYIKAMTDAIANKSYADAIKILDSENSQSSHNLLQQILLSLDNQDLLLESKRNRREKSVEDCGELLSHMALSLANENRSGSISDIKVSHLAPALRQLSWTRRPSTLDKDALDVVMPKQRAKDTTDYSIKEDRHIWFTGPFGKREKLLSLDTLEDWIGRCMPKALGREGIAIAAETGEQTLKDILAFEQDGQDSGLENNDKETADMRNDWVEGIGDEHLDEDNLSLYLRFSEGTDEDDKWKSSGFSDLSKHGHTCHIYGSEFANLEPTSSSADEGEYGKIHLLHDLVYRDGAPRNKATGILVEVARGSSLDVGMLHSVQNKSRHKCTIEFWYHLPQSHLFHDEIILARRSLVHDDNTDLSQFCLPFKKENTLWELAVLPTGLLELRTGGGSTVSSAMSVEVDEDNASNGIVSWEREDGRGGWNHVCILFSAESKSFSTEFSTSIIMNGSLVVDSASMIVNPLTAELPQFIDENDFEDAMEKSVLAFGIGPSIGFRITEIRVWACLRDIDDIKLMMHEHLRDADMKKKLKVNIRKKSKKQTDLLAPTLPTSRADNKRINPISPPSQSTKEEFTPDFANFANEAVVHEPFTSLSAEKSTPNLPEYAKEDPPSDPSYIVTLSDILSAKIGKSASSAIVSGPPATRHFGGGRGGLFGQGGQGVGPIAICGSDKSIIFYDNGEAKTYPIGASGAILSDIMYETQSEYMCCFLAKEKRMVVFELALKAVVVELQMKTKLNFWRYLPPEADMGDLCFLLITPVGGFHWKPLYESPRPRQVWKRGPELENKKILAYEEGGSCREDQSTKSILALVLASEDTSDAAVEAYCISLVNESFRLCISTDVLGAALYHPRNQDETINSLPYVAYVLQDESSLIRLNIQELYLNETLVLGDILSSVDLDINTICYNAPSLSMGTSPEALCCCHDDIIVVTVRKTGVVFAFDFSSGDLAAIGKIKLGHYIIDAAMRSGNTEHEVELVLLLSETVDTKDGRIANITISRE